MSGLLTDADRARLRSKQDRVLAIVRDNGAAERMRISEDCDAKCTVAAMRTELFPDFEWVFNRILEGYGP